MVQEHFDIFFISSLPRQQLKEKNKIKRIPSVEYVEKFFGENMEARSGVWGQLVKKFNKVLLKSN